MWTSVHEDLAPNVGAAFIDDEDTFLFRQLNDLCRKWSRHRAGPAGWKAKALGIVLTSCQRMVVVDGSSPRLKRDERFLNRPAALAGIEIFGCLGRESCEVLNG